MAEKRWHSDKFVTLPVLLRLQNGEDNESAFCLPAAHKIWSMPPPLMLGPIVWVWVCVLTGAGHGGRVGVSAEESRVAVADGAPVPERMAVRRTFGTGRVQGPGFVEARGAGCRGDRGGQDADM